MNRLPLASLGAPLAIAALFLSGASAQPARDPEPSPRGAERVPASGRSSPGRDPDIRTVYVPVFRSDSFRRDVNVMLTELVQKEIEKRTGYKVVGTPEQGDTILEGTINFADKNLDVEDPFNLPRRFSGRIEATVRWMPNPPLERERNVLSVVVSEEFAFDPGGGETSETAFHRTCKSLAAQFVGGLERLASRGRPGQPAVPSPDTAPDDPRGPSIPDEPPGDEEVWEKVRRFDGARRGEVQRNNIQIQVEKIGEKADPCKDYPLAGRCQLVHRHYKCTVRYDEQRRPADLAASGRPDVQHHVEVVYIDKDYLRRCPRPPATP